MTFDGFSIELQKRQASSRRLRVCYDVLPVLTYQAPDALFDWFELVLHAEAGAGKPLDCPEGREALALLKQLAEFLRLRIPADLPYDVKLSPWYYTAQPPLTGSSFSSTRLFRSLSLVVANLPAYRKDDQPALLAELTSALQALDIPRVVVKG